jgi:serine/threonine-protein kinase
MPAPVAPPAAGPMPTRVETKFTNVTPVPPGYPPPPSSVPPQRRPPAGRPAAAPRRGNGFARFLLAFAALAVLGVVVGVGGWLIGHGKEVAIPSVDGMSQSDAMSALRQAGFVPKLHRTYSDGIVPGRVMGTEPGAGAHRPKGSTVLLDVSSGRPRVPDVNSGADLTTVQQQIRDMGLQPAEGDAVYSDLPAGSVVSLSPAPGTVVPAGSTVTIAVSRGQAPFQMPDLTGKSVDDASRALESFGVKVGTITNQSGNPVTDGTVVTTNPAAGAGIGRGSTVNLVVSSQVRVPWLIGKTVGEARSELANLGLQLSMNPPTDDDDARVIGERPAVGTEVDPGSDVTLRLWTY